jgi:N-methylhydantoinase A
VDAGSPDSQLAVNRAYAELERTARAEVAKLEGGAEPLIERSAAVRYRGQNHELTVHVPGAVFDAQALAQTARSFHGAHEELYGYCFEHNPIELVTLRLTATLPVQRPRIAQARRAENAVGAQPVERRTIWFEGGSALVCPVYARRDLSVGDCIEGPAIIEQMDTTTIVPPAFTARVDPWLNLHVTWQAEEQ